MPRTRSWPALIIGIIVALIGLVLTVGGAWLAMLGGSLYYFPTGVAMVVAGVLLARGRLLGGWIYIAVVVLTLLWAFAEVGTNPWALVPRIVAPIILLIAVLAVMPTLSTSAARWRSGLGAI